MNSEDIIADLEGRYNRILALDADKAFFLAVANYSSYAHEILTTHKSIATSLVEKISKTTKEVEELQPSIPYQKLQSLQKLHKNERPDDYLMVVHDVFLKSTSMDTKRETDITYAWEYLDLLRTVNDAVSKKGIENFYKEINSSPKLLDLILEFRWLMSPPQDYENLKKELKHKL